MYIVSRSEASEDARVEVENAVSSARLVPVVVVGQEGGKSDSLGPKEWIRVPGRDENNSECREEIYLSEFCC